jgi:Lipid A 3-O-deacylase (PagL)
VMLLIVCSDTITTLLKSVPNLRRTRPVQARRGRSTKIGQVAERERPSGRICAARRWGGPVPPRVRPVLLVLLIGALSAPAITKAQSICESCEVQLGLGGTYHFWGPTGGLVFAATMNWDASRYELGVFRVASAQVLRDHAYRDGHLMADPYWGVSLSRRWQVFQKGPVKGFVGFGLALKTESDQLSATRWDFASQFGLRIRIPGQFAVGEVTVRHWSNAGIRLPNHGQDFVTFTIRLNSGRFGTDRADRISLEPALQARTALVARSFEAEGALP